MAVLTLSSSCSTCSSSCCCGSCWLGGGSGEVVDQSVRDLFWATVWMWDSCTLTPLPLFRIRDHVISFSLDVGPCPRAKVTSWGRLEIAHGCRRLKGDAELTVSCERTHNSQKHSEQVPDQFGLALERDPRVQGQVLELIPGSGIRRVGLSSNHSQFSSFLIFHDLFVRTQFNGTRCHFFCSCFFDVVKILQLLYSYYSYFRYFSLVMR